MLVDQPASDTALRVGLQDLVALEHRALIEVTGPAPNDRVEFSYPIFRRVHVMLIAVSSWILPMIAFIARFAGLVPI